MKPLLFSVRVAITALLFIGAILNAETLKTPAQPVISRMAIDGDAIVVTVEMPPGFTRATLQTRTALDTAWENGPEAAAPTTGGIVEFRLPKRGNRLFMRVVAACPEGQTASRDSNYLPISPKAAALPVRNPAMKAEMAVRLVTSFHFKAFIDGIDTIHIGREGLLWNHLQYKSPRPVSLNGQSWNPAEMNFIDFGTNLAAEHISWEHCRIEVISGRDIVGLEKQPEGAVVHVYDTPWGASEYEFKVYLFSVPAQPAGKGAAARLHIRANIDGSDELIVNATEARWTHKHWQWPSNIEINGASWNPQQSPILEKTLLSQGVDFRTARVVSKRGRGFANVEARGNDVLVSFADDMDGAATYELAIVFGE